MVEFIKESEVKESVEMDDLVETIRKAFNSYSIGNSKMPEKSYLEVDKGDFRSMPAFVSMGDYQMAGVKWVNVHPGNPEKELPTVMGSIVLCDPETGEPEYFVEASELTSMRTGAASGVATDLLTHEDVSSVGIIGAGKQSYKQIEAINCVRDIDDIVIHDLDEDKAEEFANSVSDARVGDKKEACSCNVLCTVTPTTEPIVNERDLGDENIHINAIGADSFDKKEFSDGVIRNNKIIVDDIEQASHSGEISIPISRGVFSKDKISATLGELTSERVEGHNVTSPVLENLRKTRTIYDSTGIAIQDIAACSHLVD